MLQSEKSGLLLVLLLTIGSCTPALHTASRRGDIKMATILLDQGVDVNEDVWGDCTPLYNAALRGHTDMVKLLLDRGANINWKTGNGYSALTFAVIQEHEDVVQLLLSRGAEVDSLSLKFAGERNDQKIALMLKAAQAKKVNKMIATDTPEIKKDNTLLIAVIDFEAKGVSRQDASRLSEWLRTELINTNQFKVIERSAMNAILKEQAFTMTGCTDTSCAVQVGKMLSARKMLVGSVEVWNNKVFINGRIIDVEKGVAEFAHRETVSSLKELDTGATSFAKNLARRINGLPVE